MYKYWQFKDILLGFLTMKMSAKRRLIRSQQMLPAFMKLSLNKFTLSDMSVSEKFLRNNIFFSCFTVGNWINNFLHLLYIPFSLVTIFIIKSLLVLFIRLIIAFLTFLYLNILPLSLEFNAIDYFSFLFMLLNPL